MTLAISLSPETEARLRSQAQATGKDVETIAREAIEEKFAPVYSAASKQRNRKEWLAEFHAFLQSQKAVGHFVDHSRESFYTDND